MSEEVKGGGIDPNDPMFGMQQQEVKYNNLKFGKVGDWFKGTLTEKSKQIKNNLPPFGMQTVFGFKAHGGSFHDIVKKQVQAEATQVVEGDFWSYITGKDVIINQIKNAKIGQVIGLRLTEIKPSTKPGFDDTKIISVFVGDMDPTYQGETVGDQAL